MANAENFPILKGAALYSLHLDKGGIREPHWHPNAAELSYCLTGKALMTIFSPGSGHDTFTVDAGEIAYIPSAYFRYTENIGVEDMQFAVFFNDQQPQDIGISGSFGAYSNARTTGMEAYFWV